MSKTRVRVKRHQDEEPWEGDLVGQVVRHNFVFDDNGNFVKIVKVEPTQPTGDYIVRDDRNYEMLARKDQMERVA